MDPQIEKWRRWISRIVDDVQSLVWSVGIYSDVVSIVTGNPTINTGNRFYRWIARNYVHTSLMTIRRQLDCHRDAVSLIKLVSELEQNPDKADRAYHLTLYQPDLRYIAESTFDNLAGAGRPEVQSKVFGNFRAQLEEKKSWLKEYTDRRIAHLDKAQELTRIGTYGEISSTAECLRIITTRVFLLLEAKELEMNPTVQYDWKAIFRTKWIPDDNET